MSTRFLATLERKKTLILDGAMGTMLLKQNPGDIECLELANLTAPAMVARIHEAYVSAGAELVETNTFGANPVRLARFGLADQASEINKRGVAIAREAVGEQALVLGSIGPLGELLEPYGDITLQTARSAFALQAEAFTEAGADACIVETMADLTEACLAVEAAVACGLPVIAQMSYEASGKTFMGVDPVQAASRLVEAGADVIGANCSVGPEQMLSVIETLRGSTPLPISALPNAGLPITTGTVTQWPLKPAEFAQWGLRLLEAGALLIGGCCGTTPDHISALTEAVRSRVD
ncbi:MAG: homocysteine S-methyltransferase family protein [Limnochordia bacterium]|jgi:5-methyltetrahydrofolate--homocysteine methyltransferase